MPARQKNLIDYIPARIYPGKDYYVAYYVVNPATKSLVIKKVRLNRVKPKSARDATARRLVHTLNNKLARGWNPFLENEAPKSLHKLSDVVETYRQHRFRDAEASTKRCYTSMINFLNDYLRKQLKEPNIFVYQFDKAKASDMMLYIYDKHAKTGKTYNNYLTFYRALFNWMKEYNYVLVNPFDAIRKKNEQEKKRQPIEPGLRDRLREYLEKNNPNFLVVCLLCYHCFMRPKEICELKVGDVNVAAKTIRVRAEIAKNDNESFRTIPDHAMKHFLNLNLSAPSNWYLFADYHAEPYCFRPGRTKIDSRKIAKYWEKLRKVLKMPKDIQFYSLKDTGIMQMFEDGVSLPEVQAQADHSSDRITRIYYRHKRKTASKEILNKASEF